MREGFAGSADESHFVIKSAYGTSDIPWEKFHRAFIAPDMVLLYVSSQQFFSIPRGFFATDAAWNELSALVGRRVPLRRRGPMVLRTVLLWLAIIVCVFLLWSVASAPTP